MSTYRDDARTRCTRCELAVPSEDLFHTVEGEALCQSCRLQWAQEQAHAAREAGELRQRPGFRLVCPECDLATMTVSESDFARVGTCQRCERGTSQLRGGAFLGASLLMMIALGFDVLLQARFLVLGTVFIGVLALVVGDLRRRRRHRVATIDEIAHADAVLKAHRRRIASEALRIADPQASDQAAEAEHAAEVEAVAGSEASAHSKQP